jgi:small subunit ribosomal protein S4
MKTNISYDNVLEKKNSLSLKLLNLFYFSKNRLPLRKSDEIVSHWFPYIYYKNPLNLLFSHDQFLYDFLLKYPQRKKMSEYKLQLKEQKKLSLFYGGLSKKQLRKYFLESHNSPGEFSKNFINLLERRLDVILYRSQFVKNITLARQLITHKKVVVNQKIMSIPSYLAHPGDIISIPNSSTRKSSVLTHLKFQKFVISSPDIVSKNWKLKKKFVSKKQIETITWLLLKKIYSRVEIQKYSNPFLNSLKQSNFHIYKFHSLPKDLPMNLEFPKKMILKTLSNFNFDELSKTIFFLLLKKNLVKNIPKMRILSNLNFFGMKPLHLESSYRLFTVIFLYSPQRVYYPFVLDFDLIKRAQLKS